MPFNKYFSLFYIGSRAQSQQQMQIDKYFVSSASTVLTRANSLSRSYQRSHCYETDELIRVKYRRRKTQQMELLLLWEMVLLSEGMQGSTI